MPFTVGCGGKYRNLSTVLKHFRYPLAVITATAGPNWDIHSDCKNNNNNNDNNIHQFQSSSSVKESNPFQPTMDLLYDRLLATLTNGESMISDRPKYDLTVIG
jgi:hypothetical protein